MPTTKLPPSGSKRIRPSDFFDPFATNNRDHNFPAIDDAFQPHGNLLDQDISMTSTASSANLSIGARAALNEHLRHVARFGLDESLHIPEEPEDPQSINPLDVEWDRLVDGNVSLISQNHSYLDTSSSRIERIQTQHRHGQESVEVCAETSSDFFNSSRVLLLSTPEKNRDREISITARDGGHHNSYSTTDSDEDSPRKSADLFESSTLSDESSPSHKDKHDSFESGVDVSRISVAGSEVLGKSVPSPPDSSFPQLSENSQPVDISGFFPSGGSGSAENVSPVKYSRTNPSSSQNIQEESPSSACRSELSFEEDAVQSIGHELRSLWLSPIDKAKERRKPTRNPKSSPTSLASFSPTHPVRSYFTASTSASDLQNISPYKSFEDESSKPKEARYMFRDQRLIRSVVPARVFMEQTSDFPEEYDSFSPKPSSQLLASFEKAAVLDDKHLTV